MNNIIEKTYVINLDRRKDRWENIQNNFKNTFLKLNRFPAIDGSKLSKEDIR